MQKFFLMSIMTIGSMAFPLNNNEYENFKFFNITPIQQYNSTNNYTFEKIGLVVLENFYVKNKKKLLLT